MIKIPQQFQWIAEESSNESRIIQSANVYPTIWYFHLYLKLYMHASLMNFFTLSFSFIEIENVYQFINS